MAEVQVVCTYNGTQGCNFYFRPLNNELQVMQMAVHHLLVRATSGQYYPNRGDAVQTMRRLTSTLRTHISKTPAQPAAPWPRISIELGNRHVHRPLRPVTLSMRVSHNTFPLEPVHRADTRELGRTDRGHSSASDADDGFTRPILSRPMLTLFPRVDDKLALKYEYAERIRLGPDTRANPTADTASKPLCVWLRRLYATLAELDITPQNVRFLADEKAALAARKLLLEERLTQEQSKNVKLRTLNERLRLNLSAITTRALELSIDKRLLQDEAQKLTWHRNYNRFLLPLQNVTFYQKL